MGGDFEVGKRVEFSVILFLLCSGIFSVTLNSLLLRFSRTLGIHDEASGTIIRWGSTSKPTIGGISFYITFILSSLVLFVMNGSNTEFSSDFMALLIVSTLGFFIGLQDDAYNTRPLLKLFGQIMCGVIMILFGVAIDLTGIEAIDYFLTIFWVVGIMNSINLLDNMDGVTGTVSLMIVITILILFTLFGMGFGPFYFTLVSVAGAILGFLVFNWHPSRIYMGDTGSQFLGALLAFIGVKFLWDIRGYQDQVVTSMQFITPVMTFLVPIMDTTFVTFARIMRGRSPFQGGKDHLTHHLTYIGVREKRIPVLLGFVSILSGFVAIFAMKYIMVWNHGYTIIFSGYIVCSFLIFYMLFRRGERISMIKDRMGKEQNDLISEIRNEREPEKFRNPS